MIRRHKKIAAYFLALTVFTSYVMLDTFVITRVYGVEDASDADQTEIVAEDAAGTANEETGEPVITSDSYNDGNINIRMSEYTVNDTAVYLAEVSLDSPEYLKTAFAQEAYGRNVTETTSDIADSVNAILAINGDFYGTQEKGYVIRNGVLYRNEGSNDREDLVIYGDGSFGIISEGEVSAEQLLENGAVQTLSFGPALVEEGEISVGLNEEVGRAMASNPRTAIGIKADGTYLLTVSDGRTDESEGLSLYELAEFMQSMGAVTAYNLDGGGSSTMVFNGTVVNDPTGGRAGHGSGSERSVSDIVYIGY
ncbi:MAG: phosphodiester glycosidase family protein [Mogibacterium sp.]|nr:phosphodiester glycosidase family protein [Mogibacterium sp.]